MIYFQIQNHEDFDCPKALVPCQYKPMGCSVVVSLLLIIGGGGGVREWVMVFNTTFNNISAIFWQLVLLLEETGV